MSSSARRSSAQRIAVLLLAALLIPSACISPPSGGERVAIPADSDQVLLCTSADWQAATAVLHCLERSSYGWLLAMDPIAVNLGENGLGWGRGRHDERAGTHKHEGDGRAPAGVFTLGTAFGYGDTAPTGVQMPYRQATARDYFVDAADSPAYNRWQHIDAQEANDPKARWASFERMRRDDALYEFGVVVDHNTRETVPGRGSAIFLHVWRGPESPTSGCTSMARADLLRVMKWLDPDKSPVLVQVPLALAPPNLPNYPRSR